LLLTLVLLNIQWLYSPKKLESITIEESWWTRYFPNYFV